MAASFPGATPNGTLVCSGWLAEAFERGGKMAACSACSESVVLDTDHTDIEGSIPRPFYFCSSVLNCNSISDICAEPP